MSFRAEAKRSPTHPPKGGRGARGSDLKCSETPCGSRGDGQGVASVPGKEVAQ